MLTLRCEDTHCCGAPKLRVSKVPTQMILIVCLLKGVLNSGLTGRLLEQFDEQGIYQSVRRTSLKKNFDLVVYLEVVSFAIVVWVTVMIPKKDGLYF